MTIDLSIETYEESGKKFVYLSHNGSSGCQYDYHTKAELKRIIREYVMEAVDYEY